MSFRRPSAVVFALVFAGPAVSPAQQPDILSAIPKDAWVVLTLRDLSELEQKAARFLVNIGALAPNAQVSPLLMLKGMLLMPEGVDDQGSAAIALMPASPENPALDRFALFIPTTDLAKLTKYLRPEPVEEGIQKVSLLGQEGYVGTKGRYAVFAPDVQIVKAILAGGEGIGESYSPEELERFEQSDVALLVNFKAVLRNAAAAGVITLMRQWGAYEALQSIDRVQTTMRLDDGAVSLNYYLKQSATAQPRTQLPAPSIEGLIDSNYVLALTMAGGDPDRGVAPMSRYIFNQAAERGILDKEGAAKLQAVMDPLLNDVTGTAIGISALRPGPDGLIGMTKIVTTKGGAREMLDRYLAVIEVMKSGVVIHPTISKAVSMMEYRRGVETAGDIKVDHLVIDLDAMSEEDQKAFETSVGVDVAGLKKVIGREGFLVRIGVLDEHRMLATFGGGLERFKEMVTANTSGAMPGARPVVTWEARLALDRLTQLIKSASLAVDKPVPVLVLPEEGDEITIVQQRVSGGEETLIRVPITIIRDIVNAAMRPGAGGGKPLP